MKNILTFIACSLLMAWGMISRAETVSSHDETVTSEQDSTVDVIGWFCKNDTIDYWINESRWKFKDGDTIKTAGISTKVRIVVTDSTDKGYKMNYTFLECRADSVSDSLNGNFQNRIVERLGKKIVGTTIKFETNKVGEITKFTNLNQIKKQAKGLFKECMKELFDIEEFKELKEMGLDFKKLIGKNVDVDELVDGYTEELNLLFMCHGKSFAAGEKNIHEDATEDEYETDTYVSASTDAEDYTYNITIDVVNTIPKSVVKDVFGEIVGMFVDDDTQDALNNEFDSQINVDASHDSYYSIDYMPRGWPYNVVKQTTNMIGRNGKAEQTAIYLDNFRSAAANMR